MKSNIIKIKQEQYEFIGKVERGGVYYAVLTKTNIKMLGADDVKIIPFIEYEGMLI